MNEHHKPVYKPYFKFDIMKICVCSSVYPSHWVQPLFKPISNVTILVSPCWVGSFGLGKVSCQISMTGDSVKCFFVKEEEEEHK